MLEPIALIMIGKATKQYAQSAQPQAPTIPASPPRERGTAIRRLTAVALRRLADRVEPSRVAIHATAA
jgi:hypothetical protein